MAKGDNLKAYQWPPGVSGNPKGRPKGVGVWELVERELEKRYKPRCQKTKKEYLAELLIEHALELRPDVLKLVIERIWPATNIHQIDAQVDYRAQMEGAAEKMREKLERLKQFEYIPGHSSQMHKLVAMSAEAGVDPMDVITGREDLLSSQEVPKPSKGNGEDHEG